MDKKPDHSRVHFFYWIGILSLSLICMTAYRWTSEPRFTEYIGNAATLTSLFLGVVAIFYSFISNDNLSNSLGNIANASESLKQAEVEIKSVLSESKMLASKQDENMQKMHQISETVQSSVATLSGTLSDIADKTTELQSTVYTFPTRFDAISGMLEAKSQTTSPAPVSREGLTPEQASYFNKSASISGNLMTYACVLAKKYDAELSAAEFNKLIGRNYTTFSNGFFDCMAATGIVRRKSVKNKNGFWKIVDMDAEIEKGIKSYFVDFVNRNYSDEPDQKADYLAMIDLMEHSFAPANPLPEV